MASNQNPIHRDRGKRDQGDQPFKDAKEALNQNPAEIDRNASEGEDEGSISEEEFRKAASDRLARTPDEDDRSDS
ncbi:MAG TPA: hypothetical protein VKZ61_10915 [Thermomicrobiales bacterium]|nr:hypothetical protein [Thermomicrobiales bacterium]